MNKKQILLLLLSAIALTAAGVAQDGDWDHEEAENTNDLWDHEEAENSEEVEEEWDIAQAERTPPEEVEVQDVEPEDEPEEDEIETTEEVEAEEEPEDFDPEDLELEVEPEQVEANETFTVSVNIAEELEIYLNDELVEETVMDGTFETELSIEEPGEHELRTEIFGENLTTNIQVMGEHNIDQITATEVTEPGEEGIICVTTAENVPAELNIIHENETIGTQTTQGGEEVCFNTPPEEEPGIYEYTVQATDAEDDVIERDLVIEVAEDVEEQEITEIEEPENETETENNETEPEENETEVNENNETEINENNELEEPVTEPEENNNGIIASIIEWLRNLFS